MDWVTTIRSEAQRNSLLRTDDLARRYNIVPVAVTQAVRSTLTGSRRKLLRESWSTFFAKRHTSL
jgi:NAD(P)H-nitrite reductase large subunit